jgi:hypothetical protein
MHSFFAAKACGVIIDSGEQADMHEGRRAKFDLRSAAGNLAHLDDLRMQAAELLDGNKHIGSTSRCLCSWRVTLSPLDVAEP